MHSRSICEGICDRLIKQKRQGNLIFQNSSAPPVTSALRWVHQLISRISTPIRSFQSLQHSIIHTEDAQMLMIRYDNLIGKLKKFEKDIFEKWAENVSKQIDLNLKQSLINRVADTKLINLNFHPELSAILREVHYLRLMQKGNIPQSGLEFSEGQETFRTYILNLEKSVEWWNNVIKFLIVLIKLFKLMNVCRFVVMVLMLN